MDSTILFSIICSVVAILYGVFSISWILKQSDGNDKMKEIASPIQEGASAYLNRQYTTISIVGLVLFLITGFVLDWLTAIGFLVGAILSVLLGISA